MHRASPQIDAVQSIINAIQQIGFPAAVVLLLLTQFEPRLDGLAVELQRQQAAVAVLSTACIARSTRPPD